METPVVHDSCAKPCKSQDFIHLKKNWDEHELKQLDEILTNYVEDE